jgi:hypothetical protein
VAFGLAMEEAQKVIVAERERADNAEAQLARMRATGDLLCDNPGVMAALMLALSDPGSVTPRAPMESLQSWQRRAVIEHAAPLIRAAERKRIREAVDALKFTLFRPGNGPAHTEAMDVVPMEGLIGFLAPGGDGNG